MKSSISGLMTSNQRQNDVILDNFDQFEASFVILTSLMRYDPIKNSLKLVYLSYRSNYKQFLPMKNVYFWIYDVKLAPK